MIDWRHYENWLKTELTSPTINVSENSPHPNLVGTDSRNLKRGALFVPLVGEKFDGHDFIEQSLESGASCFLYNDSARAKIPTDLFPKGISVSDTLKALQSIAKGWREHVDPEIVFALTGSVGKTTSKELLAHACRKLGNTVAPKSSFNNEIGVPLTLLGIDEQTQFVVLEFGARHVGDIKFLSELALPNIATCLNVREVHLSEFKTIENIRQTKTEIYRDSPDDAVIIVCSDDPLLIEEARKTGKRRFSFGYNNADVQIINFTWKDGLMEVELAIDGSNKKFRCGAAHQTIPFNLAAAVAMLKAAGLESSLSSDLFADYQPLPGRFLVEQLEHFLLVDDSYNASPASMKAGFDTCATLFPQKKCLAVLGDMLELGKKSEEKHREIGQLCQTKLKPEVLVTVGQEAKFIAEEAGKYGAKKIFSFSSVEDAFGISSDIFSDVDYIYLKASNSIRLNKLASYLKKL